MCASGPLAASLAERARGTGLDVFSFADLCRQTVAAAGVPEPAPMKGDVVSDAWIDALVTAAESYPEQRYDAIIVDEAQDIPSHWWVAIDTLLIPESGMLHAFYDTNQSLYGDVKGHLASFKLLTVGFEHNLRNTRKIHGIATGHYRGPEISADGPEGVDVATLVCAEVAIGATSAAEARRLVLHENVKPGDIAILAPDDALAGAIRQALDRSGTYVSLVDTIMRFKGLERPVVILAASRGIADEAELAYVALSRARTHLVLVGEQRTLEWLRQPEGPGAPSTG